MVDKKVKTKGSDYQTEKNVGVAERVEREDKVKKPEDKNPGKVGHGRMSGEVAEALI